jgi:hypothetical protein
MKKILIVLVLALAIFAANVAKKPSASLKPSKRISLKLGRRNFINFAAGGYNQQQRGFGYLANAPSFQCRYRFQKPSPLSFLYPYGQSGLSGFVPSNGFQQSNLGVLYEAIRQVFTGRDTFQMIQNNSNVAQVGLAGLAAVLSGYLNSSSNQFQPSEIGDQQTVLCPIVPSNRIGQTIIIVVPGLSGQYQQQGRQFQQQQFTQQQNQTAFRDGQTQYFPNQQYDNQQYGYSSQQQNTNQKTFQNTGTNTLQNTGTNTFQNTGTNTLQNTGTNTFQNTNQKTFQNTGTNTLQNTGTNTFQNTNQKTFQNTGTNTFQNTGTNTFQNTGTTLQKKAGTSQGFNQILYQNTGKGSISQTYRNPQQFIGQGRIQTRQGQGQIRNGQYSQGYSQNRGQSNCNVLGQGQAQTGTDVISAVQGSQIVLNNGIILNMNPCTQKKYSPGSNQFQIQDKVRYSYFNMNGVNSAQSIHSL